MINNSGQHDSVLIYDKKYFYVCEIRISLYEWSKGLVLSTRYLILLDIAFSTRGTVLCFVPLAKRLSIESINAWDIDKIIY